jgi:hypothetical protein
LATTNTLSYFSKNLLNEIKFYKIEQNFLPWLELAKVNTFKTKFIKYAFYHYIGERGALFGRLESFKL